MTYDARILADSISPRGYRLTSFEVTFPRLVLAEFNTHRVFSRNSASSRAIPVAKQLRRVLDEPYVPAEFGTNKPGMQAGSCLGGHKATVARREWLRARDRAVEHVIGLVAHPNFGSDDADSLQGRVSQLEEALAQGPPPESWLNVHKQLVNRLLEPFMWHTLIVTASEWSNFWHLRAHPDAQPEIRQIAELMRRVFDASEPVEIGPEGWHLPLVDDLIATGTSRLDQLALLQISVGRCARISYLTHDGKRDPVADVRLHDRLLESGHLSPFEHVARPLTNGELRDGEWSANFRGWRSYRKDLPGESDPLGSGVPAESSLAFA